MHNSRFSPTAAHPPWSGILQAISYGPACPQQFPANMDNMTESLDKMTRQYWQYLTRVKDSITHQAEDCLYLNIFRPHNVSGSIIIILYKGSHKIWDIFFCNYKGVSEWDIIILG